MMINHSAQEIFDRTVVELCRYVGTPYSQKCLMLYDSKGYEALVTDKPVLDESSPSAFSRNWGLHNFFKKCKLPTEIDKQSAALLAAEESEERCRITNEAFLHRKFTLREEQFLSKLSRKIVEVLGGPRVPRTIWDNCGWGPGATASLAKRLAQVDNKLLEQELSVTDGAQQLFRAELARDNLWLAARGIRLDGPACLLGETRSLNHNRMALVPKDAKTDRVICAEPTGNLFLQKAIGTFIRRRLKIFGVDLDNQGHNQHLARLAYAKGLATLDLKSASDSMSIGLIQDVLPFEWFCLLDSLRSHFTKWTDGSIRKNHKFSSMGNGFTFELESLIFYAVVCVLDESAYISVYGDDIICSRNRVDDVIFGLTTIGFVVNTDKSFSLGPFYESCGKHYFMGIDVSPIYQKSASDLLDVSELIRLHNRLYRWMIRIEGFPNDRVLRPIRKAIPLFQPDWLESDEACCLKDFVPKLGYNRHGWLRLQGVRSVIPDRDGSGEALLAYHMRFGASLPRVGKQRDGKIAQPHLQRFFRRSFAVAPPSFGISSPTKERILTLLRCDS
jgi:hypothetical protein